MKIEKISDNQIRCTLSKEDLIDRELRISELAYGTEKAKALFRDMMQQASYEFGFEADDIPLMIEAIPISTECLILVITKVEDPDELDTRFSKFSPDYEENDNNIEDDTAYADEIINCFGQLSDLLDEEESEETDDSDEESDDIVSEESKEFVPLPKAIQEAKEEKEESVPVKSVSVNANLTKVFSFATLNDVIKLSEHIVYSYRGSNSVFKDKASSRYYLVLSKSDHTPEEFNKVCNIISEYGRSERITYATHSYYNEHFEPIVKDSAIQILSVM